MLTDITLQFPNGTYASLLEHLLPKNADCEEAAFGFATTTRRGNELEFELLELLPVPPGGFEERSLRYLHLSDAMRAKVIKRAHDLNASLVEFHSHPTQKVPEFSASDCSGFREFVPHVSWRLKGRPYAAFVFAPKGFDALAWHDNPHMPQQVRHIAADGQLFDPTGLTFSRWNRGYYNERY